MNFKMKISMRQFSIVLILTICTSLQIENVAQAIEQHGQNKQKNLFDPLYAFDDIDAHTVSAGDGSSRDNYYRKLNLTSTLNNQRNRFQQSSSINTLPPLLDDYNNNGQQQQQFGQRLVPKTLSNFVKNNQTTTTTLKPMKFLTNSSSIQHNNQQQLMQKRQIVQSSIGAQQQQNLDISSHPDSQSTTKLFASTTRVGTERPKHWSALENYYQKLRDSSLLKSLQAQPMNQDELSYVISQQPANNQDDRLSNHFNREQLFNRLNYQQQQDQRPMYRGTDSSNQQQMLTSTFGSMQTKQNFLLPTNQNLPQQSQLFSLQQPNYEPNFQQRQQSSKFDPLAQTILGTNGVNLPSSLSSSSSSSGLKLPTPTNYNINANSAPSILDNYFPNFNLNGQKLIANGIKSQPTNNNNRYDYDQQTSILYANSNYQQQQPVIVRPFVVVDQQQQLPSIVYDENGRVKQFEVNKLNDLMRIQLLQQRLKHQQETFGSWYDHQRSKELLQEEAFCGPRNFVNYHIVTKQQQQQNLNQSNNFARLLELQTQVANNDNSVAVALSVGEFPSHMGLYNGSQPADDNFLCPATWIHERFALTLASCVAKWTNISTNIAFNAKQQQPLTIRAGEWNLNKTAPQQQQRPMILRTIERVHIFPRYQIQLQAINSSTINYEHNLALVEWIKPIDYFEVPYIWPACQMQSRQALKTNACWTPVRNITLKEYFDADGEGESKLKKSVQMIEIPVKLYANDEFECQKQTQIQYFNFLHPNYICSADSRKSNWKTKLNSQDSYGSGIYCNEGGNLSLVSIVHPTSNSTFGYMDLSYYRPWMRNVISGQI